MEEEKEKVESLVAKQQGFIIVPKGARTPTAKTSLHSSGSRCDKQGRSAAVKSRGSDNGISCWSQVLEGGLRVNTPWGV